MKRILNRLLICILITMIVTNFTLAAGGSVAYGFFDAIADAIGGFIGMIARLPALALAGIAQGILAIVTSLVRIGTDSLPTSLDDFLVQPFHVLFNKLPILDVNFLNLNPTGVSSGSPIIIFRQAVAGWYYSMRLIASMVLVVILIYVGIRMAISTIASEKASYKKMLVDWVTSLVLLFLLHYIMIFVFACNEALVKAMESVAQTSGVEDKMRHFINNIYEVVFTGATLAQSYMAVLVYGMIIMQTLSFVLSYIKRMFTIGFLIAIAPLITITYSIDKMGDQKAQALNTWLKEFVYNILLQPFQCILYIVFAGNAINLIDSGNVDDTGIAAALFAILSLQFVKEGEKIVKKIFGFDKASSLADMAAGTALAYAGMAKGKEWGAKAGSAVSGAKNLITSNPKYQEKKQAKQEKKAQKKADKASKKANSNGGNSEKPKGVIGRGIDNFKAKRAKDAEKKDREKAVELATKRLESKGVKRPPSEEEINSAMVKIKADRANRTQAKETIGKAGKATLGLAKGTGKMIYKNRKKIIGAGVGLVTAGIGLGAGDFMSIKEGAAGYQVGAGFVEGLYKNSLKTLKKDTQTNVQNAAIFTNNNDKETVIAEAFALGESDAFKDISKELKDLKQKLSMLGVQNPSAMVGNLSQRILDGNVDHNTLDELTKDIPEDKRDEAKNALAGYGALLSQRELYNNIKTAEGMNIDRERLAGMVNINSATSSHTETEVENNSETVNSTQTETQTETQIDTEKFADDIKDLTSETSKLENDVQATNARIEMLNRMLEQFNSASESQQQDIANAMNNHKSLDKPGDETFGNPEAIRKYLEDSINALQRKD